MSDYRKPENVEADIERTRQQMGETLEAIQQKLSPGRMVDEVLGIFNSSSNSSGGDLANSVVTAVKQNPLPAALAGIGLGWLMLSNKNGSQQYSTQRSYSGYPASGQHPYRSGSYPTADSGSATGSIKDKAGNAIDRARDAASKAGDKVADRASDLRERTAELTDNVQDQVGQQMDRARQGFEQVLSEQPLTLIGMGFALGAALGAGLPATQREDQIMGEMRDELKDRAVAAGSRHIEKAKAVADAAIDAAKDEADQEGLTGKDGKEKLHEVKDSVQQVAKAATQAAKEEAGKQNQGSQAKSRRKKSDTDRPAQKNNG